MAQEEIEYTEKHPRWIRWTHWINFPILTIMIWSGTMIYWANAEYWPHLPRAFYQTIHMDHRLAEGLSYHFFFMWIFAINGFAYVAYLFLSGEWKELIPNKNTFREAIDVLLHDLHLSKKPLPPGKFNGAQRIAYSLIILMGFASLVTGLAIYKPMQLGWLTHLMGGYEAARLFHYVLTLGYMGFFLIHLAQVCKAGWNNFRAMVAGYEISPPEETRKSEENS